MAKNKKAAKKVAKQVAPKVKTFVSVRTGETKPITKRVERNLYGKSK